jgi:hypothetical protein
MERKEIEQKVFDHLQPGFKRNELMSDRKGGIISARQAEC